MINIRSKSDAEFAWYFLKTIEKDKTPVNPEALVELKRSVREYSHKPIVEGEHVIGDWDDIVRVYPLPERITSKESAEEYFEEFERVQYVPSPWDCTGQWWTTRYKVFKRNGNWWVYHFMSHDV